MRATSTRVGPVRAGRIARHGSWPRRRPRGLVFLSSRQVTAGRPVEAAPTVGPGTTAGARLDADTTRCPPARRPRPRREKPAAVCRPPAEHDIPVPGCLARECDRVNRVHRPLRRPRSMPGDNPEGREARKIHQADSGADRQRARPTDVRAASYLAVVWSKDSARKERVGGTPSRKLQARPRDDRAGRGTVRPGGARPSSKYAMAERPSSRGT